MTDYDFSDALFSDCGRYRYRLDRRWGCGPTAMWIGLNPSKADAKINDPTIRKIIGFCKLWGYGGLIMTNLFALVSTDPKALLKDENPVGPLNDAEIVKASAEAQLVVAAFGDPHPYDRRAFAVLDLFHAQAIMCIGKTKDSWPKHPSRAPYCNKPVPYKQAAGWGMFA